MRRLLSLLSSALLSASVCTAQQLPPYSVLGNSTGSTGAAQALALYGIDVVSFGADPTGTNDSTTAIQNAVNAAYNNITHAAGTPGVVFFPCGMFKLTSPIEIGQYGYLIVQGSGLCTGIESVGSRAFDIHGSPNNPAYPLRDTQQVFLRDFFMVAANASESTYGLIYFTNVFDSGVENVYISCSPNAAANAIYIAESGGVKLKDVTITGSDLCTGGGNTNTNTGIRVANNSQVSLDNVDVEGFNGTGGSGIATSGAFVNLDIISSHTETDYYAYATADDFGQSSTSYQLDFSIVLYNQFFPTGTITCAANTAPCQILTSAPTSHSTTTATFALAAAGTNGVTLSATPTSTAAFPSICGYLEYYGLDYNNNQSVVPD